MNSGDSSEKDNTIDIDQIEQCQSFDELKENDSFCQFMRIFYKKCSGNFPDDMDNPSDEELVNYFVSHPTIWNETERFWKKDVNKEGKDFDKFQLTMSISNHIRGLIAGALQQGEMQLADGEDRGDIFDFNAPKIRANGWQPKFSNPEEAVGTSDAEMEFDLSPRIQTARISREGDEGYTGVPDKLYKATQRWIDKMHSGWEVEKEDIIFMRDAMTAIQETIKAFTGPEGRVVMCTPIFGGLLNHAKIALGREPETIPLINDGDQLVIDTSALENTLEKGDVFILCNPHNPTGHVYSKEELLEIKRICKKKDVKIIIDEVHDGLVFEGDFVSIGSLYDGEENPTATLKSTVKTFNLPDQPCHAMVIPDRKMCESFERNRIQRKTPTAIPNRAGIAAFTESDEWLTELLHYLEKNRDYVFGRINSNEMPGLKMTKPEGTYVAWIDARDTGLQTAIGTEFADDEPGQKGPADYFARVANVAVSNGSNFDLTEESNMFFRLNFAVPRSELKEMLDRIEGALAA